MRWKSVAGWARLSMVGVSLISIARLHPERLIVGRPVHYEGVAVLLEEVGRHRRLRNPWAHPAVGPPPEAFGERPGRVRDHGGLGRFVHVGLTFGIGIAVADDFVAAPADALCDLRHFLADRRVDEMAHRPPQFVHHVEDAPDADAQAVVAPAVVAHVGLGAERRRRMAETFAEAEVFDVQRTIEGQALAARPGEVPALDDRRIAVAVVFSQLHGARPRDLRPARA